MSSVIWTIDHYKIDWEHQGHFTEATAYLPDGNNFWPILIWDTFELVTEVKGSKSLNCPVLHSLSCLRSTLHTLTDTYKAWLGGHSSFQLQQDKVAWHLFHLFNLITEVKYHQPTRVWLTGSMGILSLLFLTKWCASKKLQRGMAKMTLRLWLLGFIQCYSWSHSCLEQWPERIP